MGKILSLFAGTMSIVMLVKYGFDQQSWSDPANLTMVYWENLVVAIFYPLDPVAAWIADYYQVSLLQGWKHLLIFLMLMFRAYAPDFRSRQEQWMELEVDAHFEGEEPPEEAKQHFQRELARTMPPITRRGRAIFTIIFDVMVFPVSFGLVFLMSQIAIQVSIGSLLLMALGAGVIQYLSGSRKGRHRKETMRRLRQRVIGLRILTSLSGALIFVVTNAGLVFLGL